MNIVSSLVNNTDVILWLAVPMAAMPLSWLALKSVAVRRDGRRSPHRR
jgi:heme exporter protein D